MTDSDGTTIATFMYPDSIQKLIEQFAKFPTIGPKTAARFVFYLMRAPREEVKNLINLIINLRKSIKNCSFCFKPFEGDKELCDICSDPRRDTDLLCIVEKEIDLISLEKTKKYQGLYFILGGTLSPVRKDQIEKLPFGELQERLKTPERFGIAKANFKEIIIATNPTAEGEATALYLKKLLAPLGKKISQLGRGLPVGGELEYADEETLFSALEGRKQL